MIPHRVLSSVRTIADDMLAHTVSDTKTAHLTPNMSAENTTHNESRGEHALAESLYQVGRKGRRKV